MDRKFFMSLLLSLATVWLIRSYFMQDTASVAQGTAVDTNVVRALVPGQPVAVPTAETVYKPLNTDVVFSDPVSESADLVTVEMDQHSAVFSTNGASLVSLAFKNHKGKDQKPLHTIEPKVLADQIKAQQGAFLLAFDAPAPYAYELVEKKAIDGGMRVVFQAENDLCRVKKTFVVYSDSFKFDLIIDVDPKDSDKAITPRLLFAAPHVADMADDTITVCSWDEAKKSLETYDPAASQSFAWFWLEKKPIFGLQDRYFVHALIGDDNSFAQRGYVKRYDDTKVMNIVEGPAIQKKASWALSFYMGPKTVNDLQAADERLSSLLSFGYLSSICKLLIALLTYLYNLLGNFGLAIIAMTMMLHLPLSPLMIYAKTKQEAYARYEPSLNRITLKYRHDKAMQNQELMRFHQEHNISPAMKLIGCLPQLIRMPIMFALFRVLSNYVNLYQAPFGGWITDLSSRDPFYILPFLTCLSMLWMNKQMTFTDEKQRVMSYFFSIVMSAVFATFSAGVSLYWLVGNVLSIGEEYVRRVFFK